MTRLTDLDSRILKLLKKHGEGLNRRQIIIKLEANPASIDRRLKYLKLHQIITSIRSFRISIYKINMRMRSNFNFKIIRCPKCGATQEVHDYQSYATCSDPSCTSKKGNRTRFFVTDKRVVRYQNIIRERC